MEMIGHFHAPAAVPIANEAGWPPELVNCIWNVMAQAQKPDFIFWRTGQVHLNRRWRQFSRLLAAEVCASAVVMVVMLDTPCSKVVWRVPATHSIHQFTLHFPPVRRVPSHFNCTLQTILEKRKISSPCRDLNSAPYQCEQKKNVTFWDAEGTKQGYIWSCCNKQNPLKWKETESQTNILVTCYLYYHSKQWPSWLVFNSTFDTAYQMQFRFLEIFSKVDKLGVHVRISLWQL